MSAWADSWIDSSFGKLSSAKKPARSASTPIESPSTSGRPKKRLLIDDSRHESVESHKTIQSFEPQSSTDLGVSKAKLGELRDWLLKCLNRSSSQFNSRFLLLTGPAGSGKTVSVKKIAEEENIEVVELPITSLFNEQNLIEESLQNLSIQVYQDYSEKKDSIKSVHSESQLTRFRRFLHDLNHYKKNLLFDEEKIGKLLLIEEFPNLFHLKPELLHEELSKLVDRFKCRTVPIVFIISEVINGQSVEQRLLPKAVQSKLNFTTITFKPITNASLTKALAKCSLGKYLSRSQIDQITEYSGGDIRNAFNQLRFSYADKNPTVGLKRKAPKRAKLSISEAKSALQGGRDNPLTLMHAVGKVLYAKRIESIDLDVMDFVRRNPNIDPSVLRNPLKESSPEVIAEQANLSCDTLVDWIFENYCDFIFDPDQLNYATDCLEILSNTNSIFTDYESRDINESLRVSYFLRGIMFSLNRDMSTFRQVLDLFPAKTGQSKYSFHSLKSPTIHQQNRIRQCNLSILDEVKNYLPSLSTHDNCLLITDILPCARSLPAIRTQLNRSNLTGEVDDLVDFPLNPPLRNKPTFRPRNLNTAVAIIGEEADFVVED